MITPPSFTTDILAPAIEVFLAVFYNMPSPLVLFVYLNLLVLGIFGILRLLYLWGS